MIRWIKGLVKGPEERGIFKYWNGSRWSYADPLVVDGLLHKHGGDNWTDYLSAIRVSDLPATGGLAKEIDNKRTEAVEKLVELTRKAFGIEPVGGRSAGRSAGLTGSETLGVLARYLEFLAQLKEKYLPLPSSPARLASSPSSADTGEWSAST